MQLTGMSGGLIPFPSPQNGTNSSRATRSPSSLRRSRMLEDQLCAEHLVPSRTRTSETQFLRQPRRRLVVRADRRSDPGHTLAEGPQEQPAAPLFGEAASPVTCDDSVADLDPSVVVRRSVEADLRDGLTATVDQPRQSRTPDKQAGVVIAFD